MKVFITGATGQLGHDCIIEMKGRGYDVLGVSTKDFSIVDEAATRQAILDYAPDVILHAAAYTAVDRAEDEPEKCLAVNAKGTENIARVAREIGAKLIYISTDYVFPGMGTAPFEVDAVTGPLNVYGKSKLAGEEAVRLLMKAYFIVRISWVFGISGNNFIRTMMKLSNTHDKLSIVDDQVGSPTYTRDLAVLLADMAETNRYGTYHATNEGFCSWAEFAAEVFRQAEKDTVVEPIHSAAYPTKTKRPHNSRLDKSSLDRGGFHHLPRWEDAVGRYLIELSRESSK